jgi:hypothetical protein
MFVAAGLDIDDDGSAEQRQLVRANPEPLRAVTASLCHALEVQQRKPCLADHEPLVIGQQAEQLGEDLALRDDRSEAVADDRRQRGGAA